MKKKTLPKLYSIILLIVVTSIVASLTTAVILLNNDVTSSVDLNNDNNLKQFLNIYASISENYYEDINKKEMLEEAIAAMLNYLGEDYSTYLDKDQTDSLTQILEGKYEGIGIEIIQNREIYNVFKDSPAEKAGLQKGDIILLVNDTSLEEKKADEIIKESTTSIIKIKILRNETELEIFVERSIVNIPAVASEMIEQNGHKIGYLSISAFSNNVYSQFKSELEVLENQGIQKLIIDVRNNSGGYLSAANNIIQLFLKKGKVMYSLETKTDNEVYKDNTDESRDYPVVILTNKGSASASEILAAALKDSYGAVVIGNTTYGKGKVQHTKSLDSGSMIKYTSSKWYTPIGVCIDEVGLEPNLFIDLEIDAEGNILDKQKEKAIEFLLSV